jgi:hypothetical protein
MFGNCDVGTRFCYKILLQVQYNNEGKSMRKL